MKTKAKGTRPSICKELWKRRYDGPLPMSDKIKLSGFARWLGVRVDSLTGWDSLELIKPPLYQGGGSYFLAFKEWSFRWACVGDYRYMRDGEIFVGRGSTSFEAALTGLMTAYEMVWHRRRVCGD